MILITNGIFTTLTDTRRIRPHVTDSAEIKFRGTSDWLICAGNQAPWGLDAVETAVGPVPSLHPGHGLNTRGLPGGTTPADRFVKIYLLREMAQAHAPAATVNDAIVVAQGLLNTVHLVRGTIASLGGLDGLEWTNWAVVKVPAERRFLLRTYSDLAWRDVDLSKIDFAKAHAPRPLYDGLGTHRSFLPPALVTQ